MIIPLDKLIKYSGNKYIFTRATMQAVDKIANIRNYPEENLNWKVVPNILKAMLDEDVKFDLKIHDSEAEKDD
ncbi:MAG: hypothetical protein FWG13_00495 [Leptospirales bacterium]|nr:hypothetical protein [Leptospirales bacterium]